MTTALKKIKKEIGNAAALIGFAGSPWTVASYLLQDCSKNTVLEKTLNRLTQETIVYLKAQIEAGVDVIQIFDSWGGTLSAEEYGRWSGSYIKEIINSLGGVTMDNGQRTTDQLRGREKEIPVILYIKESRHLLKEMLATGADVISIGWETPLEAAKEIAQGKAAIQGNFNPHILMQATPAEIAKKTETMLETMKGYPGYIANLGHGVLPKTPVENVEAFVETIISRQS